MSSGIQKYGIFFVKRCGVAVCAEQQSFRPRWCPAHLLTDSIQGHTWVGLDDQLIVDMHHNGAAPERSHGVAEDVAGRGLYDVLHELGAIGIQPFPLLRGADALISDAFAAELVRSHLGLHIGQLPPGGQGDEQHPAPAGKGQTIVGGGVLVPDGLHDGPVHSPPEFHDVRIGLPPSIHQLRELLLGQPHLQSAHRLERTHGATVAKGQFRKLCPGGKPLRQRKPEVAGETEL